MLRGPAFGIAWRKRSSAPLSRGRPILEWHSKVEPHLGPARGAEYKKEGLFQRPCVLYPLVLLHLIPIIALGKYSDSYAV